MYAKIHMFQSKKIIVFLNSDRKSDREVRDCCEQASRWQNHTFQHDSAFIIKCDRRVQCFRGRVYETAQMTIAHSLCWLRSENCNH